jgi:hypothetical protein
MSGPFRKSLEYPFCVGNLSVKITAKPRSNQALFAAHPSTCEVLPAALLLLSNVKTGRLDPPGIQVYLK